MVSERIRQMRIKPEKEGNCILMERKRVIKETGNTTFPEGSLNLKPASQVPTASPGFKHILIL